MSSWRLLNPNKISKTNKDFLKLTLGQYCIHNLIYIIEEKLKRAKRQKNFLQKISFWDSSAVCQLNNTSKNGSKD